MTSASSGGRRGPGLAILLAVIIVCLVAVAAFTLGSALGDRRQPGGSPASTGPPDTGPVVLAISLDGLRPDAIRKLGSAGAPNLHRLMAEGAFTLNARTADESTKTLPNHTGMLTGRGVEGDDGHDVTFNNDDGETLAGTHGSYVPGMFDIAHDHGRQTAFFAEKDKFRYLIRSWDGEHGRPDTTGSDDGRDKTDDDIVGSAEQIVAATKATLLDGRTDLIFLHLKAPDEAGHDAEWLSSDYFRAVTKVDAQVGDIVATVDAHPKLAKRLTVLVTADHGGEEDETTHYEIDDRQNYQIPFMAWGRGVPRGADLYALNPQRRDPGDARAEYTGPQPVRNMDVANTSLRLLGLPAIAGAVATSWPPLVVSR